jgi:hypothetical protein
MMKVLTTVITTMVAIVDTGYPIPPITSYVLEPEAAFLFGNTNQRRLRGLQGIHPQARGGALYPRDHAVCRCLWGHSSVQGMPIEDASGHSSSQGTEVSRTLISNDDEVNQDGQSFHLRTLISVNGPVADD